MPKMKVARLLFSVAAVLVASVSAAPAPLSGGNVDPDCPLYPPSVPAKPLPPKCRVVNPDDPLFPPSVPAKPLPPKCQFDSEGPDHERSVLDKPVLPAIERQFVDSVGETKEDDKGLKMVVWFYKDANFEGSYSYVTADDITRGSCVTFTPAEISSFWMNGHSSAYACTYYANDNCVGPVEFTWDKVPQSYANLAEYWTRGSNINMAPWGDKIHSAWCREGQVFPTSKTANVEERSAKQAPKPSQKPEPIKNGDLHVVELYVNANFKGEYNWVSIPETNYGNCKVFPMTDYSSLYFQPMAGDFHCMFYETRDCTGDNNFNVDVPKDGDGYKFDDLSKYTLPNDPRHKNWDNRIASARCQTGLAVPDLSVSLKLVSSRDLAKRDEWHAAVGETHVTNLWNEPNFQGSFGWVSLAATNRGDCIWWASRGASSIKLYPMPGDYHCNFYHETNCQGDNQFLVNVAKTGSEIAYADLKDYVFPNGNPGRWDNNIGSVRCKPGVFNP